MMKLPLIYLLLICAATFACAQDRTPGKVHAWYSLHHRGAQMVDENGNPVGNNTDTAYTLLLELPAAYAKQVSTDSACLGTKAWLVRQQAAVSGSVVLARQMDTGGEIIYKAARGSVLLPLLAEEIGKTCSGKTLLYGRWQGRPYRWTIPAPKALPPVFYP